MSHLLNASELAEVCRDLDLTKEQQLLEIAAQLAAEAIARKLQISIEDDASTEPGFGGLCVGFGPGAEDQLCPDVIRQHDQGSEWAETSAARDRELDALQGRATEAQS